MATPEGSLILTAAALGAVAGHAALRCPGVAATQARRLKDELRLLLDPPAAGDPREAGLAEIDLDGEQCRVGLDIVVVYGARIPEVCRAVVLAVDEDLRRAAGFSPDHVEVRVVGVRAAPPAPAARASGAASARAAARRSAAARAAADGESEGSPARTGGPGPAATPQSVPARPSGAPGRGGR